MNNLLHTLGSLGWLLGFESIVTSLAAALITVSLRRTALRNQAVKSVEGLLHRIERAIYYQATGAIMTGEQRREVSPEFQLFANMLHTAIESELRRDQARAFWPNLRLTIFTNFLTNLAFFILGVIVTLLTTQPH